MLSSMALVTWSDAPGPGPNGAPAVIGSSGNAVGAFSDTAVGRRICCWAGGRGG